MPAIQSVAVGPTWIRTVKKGVFLGGGGSKKRGFFGDPGGSKKRGFFRGPGGSKNRGFFGGVRKTRKNGGPGGGPGGGQKKGSKIGEAPERFGTIDFGEKRRCQNSGIPGNPGVRGAF